MSAIRTRMRAGRAFVLPRLGRLTANAVSRNKKKPVLRALASSKGQAINLRCHLCLVPAREPSHEHANTCSARNVGVRSGYSALRPFPFHLGEPFADRCPAGFPPSPALCEGLCQRYFRFNGFNSYSVVERDFRRRPRIRQVNCLFRETRAPRYGPLGAMGPPRYGVLAPLPQVYATIPPPKHSSPR